MAVCAPIQLPGDVASSSVDLEPLLAELVGAIAARSVVDAGLELADLARMGPRELASLPNIGPRRAATLRAALELGRRAATAWPRLPWRIRGPGDVADRLVVEMGLLEREELRVLLLTTKNAVVSMRTVYVGNLAGSSVRVGELFQDAVRRCAAGIVVVHNHPSGDPSPSGEDLRITGEIAAAGALLDIALLDHLVIGHGRWVSLRALGAC